MPVLMPLRTPRLTLRPVAQADAEMLWALWEDPAVFAWVGDGSVPSLESVQLAASRYEACWVDHGWGPLMAIRTADGAELGACGLFPVAGDDGVLTGEIELGHRYSREFWGQGYAGEAAREVMRWAARDLGLTELVSIIQEPNTASRRIAESCGFELAGTRERTRGERSYRVCWYRWRTQA